MGIAMLLKFAVGPVKFVCNLLKGGVRTIVAAMRAGGRVSLAWAVFCSVVSKVSYFTVQVGSPNMSIHAVLVVDIDHDEVKGRWNIVGEVPGKKFRNFCNYNFVKYGGCKDPDHAQTKMADRCAEACRYA